MASGDPAAARPRRLGATRGFLFADLRGYTAFLDRNGANDAAALLKRYRELVRRAVDHYDGAEIRTEGDSFYVVFPDASAALSCGLAIVGTAAEATDANPALPIEVGIGVHAGETVETDEGPVGAAVNLAARLCAAAPAGEVWVSDTVRSLTDGIAPVRYEPRGRRRFKGLSQPVSVYRVAHVGSRPSPRRSHRPLVALGAAAALSAAVVIVAFIGGALTREGLGGAIPSPTVAAIGSSRASTGQDGETPTEPPASLGAFPSEGETELLGLVDNRYHRFCERAAADSTPVINEVIPQELGGGSTQRPVAFAAGVSCAPFRSDAPDELTYWLISDWWVTSAVELIAHRAAVIGAQAGSCAEQRPALEEWSAGPISGRLMCAATSTGASLYWTYDGTEILGRAVRLDGDMDALLAWWRADARLQDP